MADATDSPKLLADILPESLDRLARRQAAPPMDQADREYAARKTRLRVHNLALQLGARYSPARVSLDRFRIYHDAQKPVLDRLRALAPRLVELVGQGRGLIFFGPVGTGKDHLLAALLYAVAEAIVEEKPCHWVNGQEVFGQSRDRMKADLLEGELIQELARPQVLAISDPVPAVGELSAWNVGLLYRVLDRRYREMKATWASLNALSVEDADAKLSAPVFDRLREGAELFPCFWPSWRERRAV